MNILAEQLPSRQGRWYPPRRIPRLSLPTIAPEPTIREYRGNLEADLARINTIKAADPITGRLSNPSKMPEYALNLPAKQCHVGARLQATRGSVCNKCYAPHASLFNLLASMREWAGYDEAADTGLNRRAARTYARGANGGTNVPRGSAR